MDDDGYLQFFTIVEVSEPDAMHLVRHDVSLMGLAVRIFGVGKV